jgi:hypothetical protein
VPCQLQLLFFTCERSSGEGLSGPLTDAIVWKGIYDAFGSFMTLLRIEDDSRSDNNLKVEVSRVQSHYGRGYGRQGFMEARGANDTRAAARCY